MDLSTLLVICILLGAIASLIFVLKDPCESLDQVLVIIIAEDRVLPREEDPQYMGALLELPEDPHHIAALLERLRHLSPSREGGD